MKRNKAIYYRIQPNQTQIQQMGKTFGCVRFVYNHYLEQQTANHEEGKPFLSKTTCNNDCNRVLKDAYPWLREVDKFAVTNAIFHLDDAFQRFFKKLGGYPRFKNKRGWQSYTTNLTNTNIKILERHIQLPKLGRVKAVIHRRPQEGWTIKSATVSKSPTGKYYVSVLFAYESQVAKVEPHSFVGLDFSVPKMFVSSEADLQTDPAFLQHYRKTQEKLAREQRKLSHRQKGSGRYEKQRRKVAKWKEKIANQRKDYLQKMSTQIANGYDAVCIESFQVRDMIDCLNILRPGMGKYVLDNGWYKFTQMLAYKLEDRGKYLIEVEAGFPSSQLCSECGYIKTNLTLADRSWTCPECGSHHDRDINAAINLKREGKRLLSA